MKKALSLVLALMMLMSMCVVPAVVAEPDGSAENPYYVTNPTMTPSSITIPANSTVYYQYNVMVFNGWEVGGYGLSAITVDGVVYDKPDMWGEIYAPLSFNMMSPGLVGYVNNTAEEVQVMLSHTEPVGTESNPAMLEDGDNAVSIPASMMDYVAVYVPMVNGEHTFSTEQAEDFQVIVFADAAPSEGGTPNYVENGSLTLTLESWVPVYVIIAPIGMTGDVVLTVTPPKAGTADNPIWLTIDEDTPTYEVEAGDDLYFQMDSSLAGNTLEITSVAGAEFTADIDGVEYASEGGVLSVVLESANWYIEMILSSEVDNEVAFAMEYAEGSMENPIALEKGDNAISLPAGSAGRYYSYVVEQDGVLVATASDLSCVGYMDMYDEYYEHSAFLMSGSVTNSMMMPVTAGEVIAFSVLGVDDMGLGNTLAVEMVLTVEIKDAILYNTFESEELEGWGSSSNLTIDDMEYAAGWYSAKFEVNKDWGNIYNYINVQANTEYEISFKLKGTLANNLWVKFHKADWTGDIGEVTVSATEEWTEYTVNLNSGDNTTVILMFQYAGEAVDGQTLWLDDIVVAKIGADQPEIAYGDLNGDGDINNRDLALIQQHINGWEVVVDEAAADVNGDGDVNNRDLALLQQYINGWDVTMGA